MVEALPLHPVILSDQAPITFFLCLLDLVQIISIPWPNPHHCLAMESKKGVDMIRLERPEEVYDREEIFGRDVTDVFKKKVSA